jgi:hypothetical protein
VISEVVKASDIFFTGTPAGKEARDVARLRIVTLKVGSANRAKRSREPTDPDAPRIRTFLIAIVDRYVAVEKTA